MTMRSEKPQLVITVHGTGGGVPNPEHPYWWQPESSFCEQLRTDWGSPVDIHMFLWDGKNSEQSRREGGRELYKVVSAAERAGRSYAIVGHSHGGSVIRCMLREAAHDRRRLDGMMSWTTVGTPFFAHRRSWNILSRFTLVGHVLALVTLVVGVFAAVFGSVVLRNLDLLMAGAVDTELLLFLGAFLTFAAASGGGVLILRRMLRRSRTHIVHSPRVQAFLEDAFAGRWIGHWDRRDEAVNGLVAALGLRGNIAPRDLGAYLVRTLAASAFLFSYLGIFVAGHLGLSPDSPIFIANALLTDLFQRFLGPMEALAELDQPFAVKVALASVPFVSVVAVVSACVAFFATVAGLLHTALIARPLAAGIDSLLWSQLRGAAVGADVLGETAVSVGPSPTEFDIALPPLPDDLSSRLKQETEQRAYLILERAQDFIAMRALAGATSGASHAMAGDLGLDELTHNLYFEVREIRELIINGMRASFETQPTSEVSEPAQNG